MSLKPWREVAEPHADVREGKFMQAEFAADLSRVHAGSATAEYQNAALFFQRTFITEGMGLLLDSVVRRISGLGGDPVIQLQTAFGGGKTHTMLAVYHLVKGEVPASELHGISPILDAASIVELPRARVAVIDGNKSAPNQPFKRDGQSIRTLWGDLAWQLGGAEGYAMVADADASGTSPGKAVLEDLLNRFGPCVILVDELVAYIRQFEDGKSLTGGTFDSNLSFVQALTEALKGAPTSVMLASLPESEREAGSKQGERTLSALSHYFSRIQALWKPVGTEEAFEIVRRRLFSNITDTAAMESACRAYADFYIANKSEFPQETQEARYLQRLEQAYPIHPEFFDRLYEDWSTLETFQRTRGVLKLMAKVIHQLWKDGNNDPLIMPGSMPLADRSVRTETLNYLPHGWDPVIERDVDGDRSLTWEIENKDTRLGAVQACRRVARTLFLGSAPSTTANQRGVDHEHLMLGVAQPGHAIAIYKDALTRLKDKLYYLNHSGDRFWLDTRPNLRREMEDRKRRFNDRDHVYPEIRQNVQRAFTMSFFAGVHIFTRSGDVPDDMGLRLVILPPDAAYVSGDSSPALDFATDVLKKRGEQPRFRQNRLIFIAPDAESISRLNEHVRSVLAWRSIVADYKENRITLDNVVAKQAQDSLQQAESTVKRSVLEVYRRLMIPYQEALPGKGISSVKWETYAMNAGAPTVPGEIERILRENELVITEWAPIHLANLLKTWFWKNEADEGAQSVWNHLCQQLYMPRLKDESVFQKTLEKGSSSRDFFALAQGKSDEAYLGFTFGAHVSPTLDASLLIVRPDAAQQYLARLEAAEIAARVAREQQVAASVASGPLPPALSSPAFERSAPAQRELGAFYDAGPSTPSPTSLDSVSVPGGKTRFHGSIDLQTLTAKSKFTDILTEVVAHLANHAGARVTIHIDIDAEAGTAFPEHVVRTVRENARQLGFTSSEFEE